MNEQVTIMQAEEAEEEAVAPKEENPPQENEMTYTDTRDSGTPTFKIVQTNLDPLESLQEPDTKIEPINYEGDIEKMVPDSNSNSSESEDGSKLEMDAAQADITTEAFKTIQESNSSESIRTWLQKISQMQTEIQQKLNLEQATPNHSFGEFPVTKPSTNFTPNPPATNPRVVKYQDLPYMGEMTLDNSKPRRGRKPKKADICHLIYKNYGTIFPGTPNPRSLLDREGPSSKRNGEKVDGDPLNRSDVQNRIISSLLEKRLTQETKKQKDILCKPSKITQKSSEKSQNEPLNLCVRDLNQLKIRLLRKSDDIYLPEVKSEPPSDDEVEFVQETPSPSVSFNPEALFDGAKSPDAPGGYVYWPNAGVFIHPVALQQQLMYYQKMAQNSNYTLPSHSPRPPSEKVSPAEMVHQVPELRKLVPKIRPKKTDTDLDSSDIKPKRNSSEKPDKNPVKRKRSAIFIPPIPPENQTNPATEVSICKFKFTGGAKPSLQEKKMLSVDSGGNFRYYSGTGDKSMRGYEFFPRETLQQQIGNTQGSSTGAFLQASGEKIHPSTMVDLSGKTAHADFMLTPDLPPSIPPLPDLTPRHKKRKSRKSLQREKLEQTFKEKGFLIQTQQLESAEGATYCKFRQLRKFTRYLFRSWKDYLPGSVTEGPEGERSENDGESEQDMDNLSSRLSHNSGDVPTTA